MHTIGIINISGKINGEYIRALENDHHQVIPVQPDDVEAVIKKTDGVIIYDETQEHVGETCNLILRIKEQTDSFVWTFSKHIPKVNRLVYLQLGANGNIQDQCEPTEFRLIIRNAMNHRASSIIQLQQTNAIEADKSEDACTDQKFQLVGSNQSVRINGGQEIELTKLEFKVFNILSDRPGQAVSYQELCRNIWGIGEKGNKARVANLIFHLRNKLESEVHYKGKEPIIRTIRSKGYMLNQELKV